MLDELLFQRIKTCNRLFWCKSTNKSLSFQRFSRKKTQIFAFCACEKRKLPHLTLTQRIFNAALGTLIIHEFSWIYHELFFSRHKFMKKLRLIHGNSCSSTQWIKCYGSSSNSRYLLSFSIGDAFVLNALSSR